MYLPFSSNESQTSVSFIGRGAEKKGRSLPFIFLQKELTHIYGAPTVPGTAHQG